MTTIGDVYGGDYLKAADLQGQTVRMRIASFQIAEFDDDSGKKKKVVLCFDGTDKELVVNITNANSISELYGPEVEGWIGKTIELYTERVQFGAKMVDAIRVRYQAVPTPVPAPVAAPAAPVILDGGLGPINEPDPDDLPF